MRLIEVLVIVLFVTLPFGFYRAYTRRFTARWFLAIHLPVPLVFLARFEAHLPYTFIPFTCLAFFTGQFLGGTAGRSWLKRHSVARAQEGQAPDSAGVPPSGDGSP